jgi:HicB-like antitoxin of HicAB toxin-antitoxin system
MSLAWTTSRWQRRFSKQVIPGVATAASSLDEARTMADEALAFHIEGMLEDGEPVPVPTSFEQVMWGNAVAFIRVRWAP